MKFSLGEGPEGRGWWAVGSGFPWSVPPGRAAAGRPLTFPPLAPAGNGRLSLGVPGEPTAGLAQSPPLGTASGSGALKPSRSSANTALGDLRRTFAVAAVYG